MDLPERIDQQPGPVPPGDALPGFLPDGSLTFDASGKIVSISPEMVRLLGRPIAGLTDEMEDSDDFPGERVLEVLRKARDGWTHMTKLVTLDRQHRHYVLVRTDRVRQGPGMERMLARVMDLTEILRESDLAGDFVRQVRHDLRGPLTSLRGAVDLLRSERVGSLEERQMRLLELMDRATQQMVDMLSTPPTGSPRDPGSAP